MKCHYFSENPPSLERLEARLLLGISRELCTEDSPPLLLELLLLDLLDEGLLVPSMGVWSSTLNLAVAVTFVTFPPAPWAGEELLEEPVLEVCGEKWVI